MAALRTTANPRWWAAIGLLIVTLFGAVLTDVDGPREAPADHHISATGELDHLYAVDHGHVGVAAVRDAPDMFADTLLPRMRITLPMLGLVFAAGVLCLLSPRDIVLAGRDPPRDPLIVFRGRDVLARLCISRR